MIYHDLTGHDLTGDGAEEAVVRVRYGGSSSILYYHVYTLMDVQVAAAPTT